MTHTKEDMERAGKWIDGLGPGRITQEDVAQLIADVRREQQLKRFDLRASLKQVEAMVFANEKEAALERLRLLIDRLYRGYE